MRWYVNDKQRTKEREEEKTAIIAALFLVSVCCVAAFVAIIGLLVILPDTPYKHISQALSKPPYKTREISGFTVRDKSDKYYEYQAELLFTKEGNAADSLDFSFFWDIIAGFDEDAVTFDDPNVTYTVEPADEGWRRLTVHCKNFTGSRSLTAKFIYSAESLIVRDTPHGYYRWDIDAHTDEEIPELNREMATLESPYACANWIKNNITYETISEAPQTAAETFRAGKGDCDDIALLFCYMVRHLFPEAEPRIVEGWTTGGRYHANVLIHTDSGWLMLDPSFPDVKLGVFDFGPFAPSSRISVPFNITDESGHAVTSGGLSVMFGKGTVAEL
jgi:hypothetical protein